MQDLEELLCYHIAFIRAVGLINQNSHWLCKSSNFYGNHLMFERIYDSAVKDADALAEKYIGVFGQGALDCKMQPKMICKIMELFSDDDPIQNSLKAEKQFLILSDKVHKVLNDEDKLSLGVANLIEEIASHREEACYLLEQASETNMSDFETNAKIAGRKKFLNRVLAQKTNLIDETEQERLAEADLKKYISMTLIKIAQGNLIGFNLRLERKGGDFNEYSLRVGLPKGAEKFVQPLQEALPAVADRIPFFKGKIKDFSVVIA